MRKQKKQNQSIYEHIWRAMALVIIVVFVLGGTAVTIYVDKSITEKIEEREHSSLVNADTILSNQIATTQQTLNMLLTNPFVVQSIYTGNQEWDASTYKSGQTVVNAVNSNQIFNSIYVIADDKIAIKSSRRYQTKEDEKMLIKAMQYQFQAALIPWKTETGSRICHNLMVLSALDAVGQPNTTGGALINMDLDRLASIAFNSGNGSAFYMVYEDQIIASTVPEMFFTSISSVPALEQAHQTQRAYSNGYHVYSLTNDTYGYTLYSVHERAVLMMPVISGLFILMMIITALLLISLLISRRVALHAYTPVKTVLIQLEEQLPADPDAAEDLNDLQRASCSIRRTSEIVSAYRRDADTARLSRFIHNGVMDPRIQEILYQHLGYTGGETLLMLLFQSASLENAHMASDVLQGSLNGYARFLTLDMPGQRLLSLISLTQPDASDAPVLSSIEQVVRLVQAEEQEKVVVVMEDVSNGLDTLSDGYARLIERLRRSVFCQRSAYLGRPTERNISDERTRQLQQSIQAADEEAFQTAMAGYLESCSQMTAREAYHQLATLCMRAVESSSRRGLDMADRLDTYRSIHNALLSQPDYAALTNYIQATHQMILHSMEERSADENNPMAESILAYIKAHFEDPMLSAAQVADALNVSVSHLSRVMNKSLGCGFPETLQRIRLEYACGQLIAQPDIPIAQLAQQCGFSSASYFTASFKKKYGVTPSGYRQRKTADKL